MCSARHTANVTNAGAANPSAAGDAAEKVAKELGLNGLRLAVVTGDDVLAQVQTLDPVVAETGLPVSSSGTLLSANAYLGADGIVDGLARGADLVITGRVADPSLYLGPLRHEYSWPADDYETLGRGALIGHLGPSPK
jgi:Acyclic terpene utilisation family protein AtuA